MSEINCPIDLNTFILEHPFENTFPPEECECKKAYGDCYHCFASAIAKRDRAIRENARPKGEWVDWKYDGSHTRTYKCSICGRTISIAPMDLNLYPFCHCGADMRKGGAE